MKRSAAREEIAWPASARRKRLLLLDPLLERPRDLGIALADLGEGGAGDVALVEPEQRHAELEQHLRRLLRLRVALVGGQEDLRGVAIFLLPEQRFAEPEMRIRRLGVLREAGDMVTEAGLCRAVVTRQDELVGVAVELFGIVGRRQRGDRGVLLVGSGGLADRAAAADRRLVADAAAGDVAVLVEGDRAEALGRQVGTAPRRRRGVRLARRARRCGGGGRSLGRGRRPPLRFRLFFAGGRG